MSERVRRFVERVTGMPVFGTLSYVGALLILVLILVLQALIFDALRGIKS
jgi:hypothetical protein